MGLTTPSAPAPAPVYYLGPVFDEFLELFDDKASFISKLVQERKLEPLSSIDFDTKPNWVAGCPLRRDLPAGLRNANRVKLDFLRLPGHSGDATQVTPACKRLQDELQFADNRVKRAGAVVNVMGCGKTKAVMDLLQVQSCGTDVGCY
jgi:hypothetical protein